jgi:2-oxoglutarate dehydrogenase E2 component (dihydrolipoamide succinyltransferase)
MPQELKIPPVGESISEVQISEWLKQEGEVVKRDESVAVIDSEKTTFELPSPIAGRITKILHQAGDTVGVGEVIAYLEADGGGSEKERPSSTPAAPQPKEKAKAESGPKSGAATAKQAEPAKPPPATNNAQQSDAAIPQPEPQNGDEPEVKADEPKAGVEREQPAPTEAPVKSRQAAPKTRPNRPKSDATTTASPVRVGDREEEVVPMTMLRRTVARRLVEARQSMAMLTTFAEVDMGAIQALRKEHQETFEKRYQVKLGLMSFFVKAAIDALRQFPQLNAEIRDDDIVYHNYFDIGVAIATERGLVVPVLRNAEALSFAEVEKAIGDLAQRAKAGRLKPEELEGGTFTITNGGVFGSLLSTPIINPPQTGILGMHTIQERPVAIDGQVVVRPMMYLALTYDHRIVDGREAVLFLRRIKEVTESIARMLIEV